MEQFILDHSVLVTITLVFGSLGAWAAIVAMITDIVRS